MAHVADYPEDERGALRRQGVRRVEEVVRGYRATSVPPLDGSIVLMGSGNEPPPMLSPGPEPGSVIGGTGTGSNGIGTATGTGGGS
jgi:hypothetical protein